MTGMSKQSTELISLRGSAAKAPEGDEWLEIFSLFVHDLESPIASVKYLLKLIKDGKFDPSKPQHQRIVHSSKIALERAESVLFDVMAVARAGEVGIPVHIERVPLDTIIREATEMVMNSAHEHNVEVILPAAETAIAVLADASLLKRVIDNLLFNAIRHTPGGGKVTVSAESASGVARIRIRDSGPGLGDTEPEFLFSKYGQVQLRAEGKHRGVGLGLHFCKLAMEGMGGGISATNRSEGGAEFSVTMNVWENKR